MAEKARHAFGSSTNVENALNQGVIDAYDILFLDGDTDNPKVGWVDKNGEIVICQDTDVSDLKADIAAKPSTEEVETKVEAAETKAVETAAVYTDSKIEAAMAEHVAKKFEVSGLPVGALVDYKDYEIRIMCPVDTVFTKQSVGVGGDADTYYMTFKTFAPNEAVGYREHIGDKFDVETLTDIKTDSYGRKYQPTWLGLAKYNEAAGEWTYYGKNSTVNKYVGWNYRIDWYNADGVVIASDAVRINLSNENCHSVLEPYYMAQAMNMMEIIEF